MKLITVILAAVSVSSTSQVYYDPVPEHSNYQSQVTSELENQGHKNLEQTNYIVLGMYEMEQSLNTNGQTTQQDLKNKGYGRQRQHETQNGQNYAEIMTNDQNSEQHTNYNDNEYIKQVYGGQFDTDLSQNKIIGDEIAEKELVKTPKIIEYQFEGNNQAYQYNYHTENGIQAHETGKTGKEKQVMGAYAYIGDDGKSYSVTYFADEHGFRAEGEHLPTPPPVPAAIVESLKKNAMDEANGIIDDGQYKEMRENKARPQEYHKAPVHHITSEQNVYNH